MPRTAADSQQCLRKVVQTTNQVNKGMVAPCDRQRESRKQKPTIKSAAGWSSQPEGVGLISRRPEVQILLPLLSRGGISVSRDSATSRVVKVSIIQKNSAKPEQKYGTRRICHGR